MNLFMPLVQTLSSTLHRQLVSTKKAIQACSSFFFLDSSDFYLFFCFH